MKSRPLNDFTRKELEAAQESALKKKGEDATLKNQTCQHCGVAFVGRSVRKFCGDSCKVMFCRALKSRALATELADSKEEIRELREENRALRAAIARLRGEEGAL